MRVEYYSGLVILIFLTAAGITATLYVPSTLRDNSNVSISEVIKGRWGAAFEKSFGENLPAFNPIRNFWGKAEYNIFNQGRKGVIVGKDGWFFTDEEFSCPKNFKENFSSNLEFIAKVKADFAKKGTSLVIVFIPS